MDKIKIDNMNISEELKSKAISLGLCAEWTKDWGMPDKDELCDKYIRGIDFAIEHDYPSLDYMKANFDGIMQKHGIYVSEELHLLNPSMVIANGKCYGAVYFDCYTVGRLYVRHNSDLSIIASGNSKVFISMYDQCRMNVICRENAKVYVYRHGGYIEYEGEVRIREDK